MSATHKLETLVDVLKLTPDEFKRFLPDFCVWYAIGREMQDAGAEMVGMDWLDDGRSGEVHSIRAHITEDGKDTGRVEVWPGTAYTEGGV